jgi:CheY-like chemotaxis protein
LWGKTIRVVACTATDTKEQRAACFAAGMDDFLAKPVSYDSLKAVLKKA